MTDDCPVTLITGARKGIGRFLGERLARQGHRVIGCSRSPADWEAEGYEHFIADVSDEAAVKQLFLHIQKSHRRLDNLINNAGQASMNHTLLTPVSTLRRLLEVNFVGTFLLSREAAKMMQVRSYGRIVNFSTVAVPLRLAGEAAYVASKSAVESFTRVLARELARFQITVNALGPTPVETDLIRSVPRAKIDALLSQQAIPRLATFEDVAHVVEFLLDRKSGFVTGQVLYLGGV
jgi:3-oxoacyl-[acyl-carrier protein] reductase